MIKVKRLDNLHDVLTEFLQIYSNRKYKFIAENTSQNISINRSNDSKALTDMTDQLNAYIAIKQSMSMNNKDGEVNSKDKMKDLASSEYPVEEITRMCLETNSVNYFTSALFKIDEYEKETKGVVTDFVNQDINVMVASGRYWYEEKKDSTYGLCYELINAEGNPKWTLRKPICFKTDLKSEGLFTTFTY